MHKLSCAVDGKLSTGKLPSIDDMLNDFVNEVMDQVGSTGDDVNDVEVEENEGDESDDEQFELLDEYGDEETDMNVNSSLYAAIAVTV